MTTGSRLGAAGPSLPLQGAELPSALPDAQFFTGIDRAAGVYAVCVLTAAGEITAEFTIAHSSGGIASPMRRVARYGDPGGLLAAIEPPEGR